MKLFWMFGCCWGAIHYVEFALSGRAEYGVLAPLAVGFDWLTVVAYAAAFVGAIRADAPWLSFTRAHADP